MAFVVSRLPSLRAARPSRVVALIALLWLLPATALAADASTFEQAMQKGPLYLGLAAFGFGLLVSLTPCVYPMVAVTVSVFGASKSKGRLHSFALSGAFVLGLIAMFVPLGVGAAITGETFGTALASKWVVLGLSFLFVALAASMFGMFELDLPSSWKNRLAGAGGTGYVGAFVLGMACGPIAAPCTGPFLYGLLAWIAQTQSVLLGTAAMTAFAAGLGTPFFLVGAFAMNLPKSGQWMMHVKSGMGIILIVVALYFVGNAFPALREWAQSGNKFLGVMAAVALLGLVLGAVHKSFEGTTLLTRLGKGVGIALVSVAGFGAVSGITTPERTLTWEKPEAAEALPALIARAKKAAKEQGRPILLDFTADWCVACKEIENHTFPDERVQQAAGRFIAVKADMTDDADPAVEKTFKQYAILGLPTLILFDTAGKEAARFFGDVLPPEKLAAAMELVK